MAAVNLGDDGTTVLLNRGDGTFSDAVSYSADTDCYRVAIGDLNDDGRPDLVTLGAPDLVLVRLNRGDGTFSDALQYQVGNRPISFAIGDLDGDGRLDISTANEYGGNVSVLIGRGDGTFAHAVHYRSRDSSYGLALGDFNSDKRLDIATPTVWDNSVTVLMNQGGRIPGDVDGDEDVDLSDLSEVLWSYASVEGEPCYNRKPISTRAVSYRWMTWPRCWGITGRGGSGFRDNSHSRSGEVKLRPTGFAFSKWRSETSSYRRGSAGASLSQGGKAGALLSPMRADTRATQIGGRDARVTLRPARV